MLRKRMIKEALQASKYKDKTMLLLYKQQDMLKWQGFIHGPKDSPYQQGIFHLRINLSTQYPFSPPSVNFISKIFHPNIHYQTGEVCLDVIKEEWTPNWSIEGVCRAISLLMENPNADSPLNCDAGNLLRNGEKDSFIQMARMYTLDYSIPKYLFQEYKSKI